MSEFPIAAARYEVTDDTEAPKLTRTTQFVLEGGTLHYKTSICLYLPFIADANSNDRPFLCFYCGSMTGLPEAHLQVFTVLVCMIYFPDPNVTSRNSNLVSSISDSHWNVEEPAHLVR